MANSRKLKLSSILSRVENILREQIQPDTHLVIGLSGGMDSVVLLSMLTTLSDQLGFTLSVLHVNHGISPNANKWGKFCLNLCDSHGIPIKIAKLKVSRLSGTSLEAVARDARYQIFKRLKADYVILAQHLDDQAETLLLQLLRGAGVKGLEDIKPSSRQYPYIRFDVEDKSRLYRLAVSVQSISKHFASMEKPLLEKFSINIEAGEKIAIIGPNGIGKTTLLRCLSGDLTLDAGEIKWAEKAHYGYFAQDHAADFEMDMSLTDWMTQWRHETDDDQDVRSVLGKLLFSGDEVKKSVKVISGGEQGRMLFGKLILQKSNVLLMDEPTNHLDMESIESLNNALEKYSGTLIFVSHDREFVSSLATRIIEMKPDGITDFKGSYEEYLRDQGVV